MAAHHIAKYIRHAPVSKPHVDPKVKYAAKFLGATMWFYIFYRLKEDFIGGHHWAYLVGGWKRHLMGFGRFLSDVISFGVARSIYSNTIYKLERVE